MGKGKELLQSILEAYSDEPLLKADGFDDAVIGVSDNFSKPRLVYSVKRCIKILVEGGMTDEEAMEHFYNNVSGSYVGEQTPVWCEDNF